MDRYAPLPVVKSYTSTRLGPLARANELLHLLRSQARGIPERGRQVVAEMQLVEDRVRRLTGLEMADLRVLDIGPGQQLGHMTYLATKNEVTGIDLDANPQGWQLGAYLQLLKTNGGMRLAKTVGRKLLGVDRRLRRSIVEHSNARGAPRFELRQMDATQMAFEDSSFDLVFSRAVFEHIAEPRLAFREVARVLRPGGVAHINIHLYTCDSGCHDVRILAGQRGDLPYWAHLRDDARHLVIENSFLNKIRLTDWEAMAAEELPGSTIESELDERESAARELEAARAQGALAEYEDPELLTVAMNVVWTKPDSAASR